MGIVGKGNDIPEDFGWGGRFAGVGGLGHFTNEAMMSRGRAKKSGVTDKLIGGICEPQGLVLMWRPDGVGWYAS